jgi:hypothetical protein
MQKFATFIAPPKKTRLHHSFLQAKGGDGRKWPVAEMPPAAVASGYWGAAAIACDRLWHSRKVAQAHYVKSRRHGGLLIECARVAASISLEHHHHLLLSNLRLFQSFPGTKLAQTMLATVDRKGQFSIFGDPHYLKVIGSNPMPATKINPVDQSLVTCLPGFFMCPNPFSSSLTDSEVFPNG